MVAEEDRYAAYGARTPEEGPGPVGYVALVIAWAVPGLGHVIIGQWRRGLIFAVTIHALFAGGLLIGGIRAINPQDQPIWRYTQFLAGWPMLVANPLERRAEAEVGELKKLYDAENLLPANEREDERQARIARSKKFLAAHPLFAYHPKVQDMGSVYCGIAGMLNLLVMFDVLLRVTGSSREDPAALKKERRTAASAAGVGAAAEGAGGGGR